jgi:hypothetical protein
MTLTRTTVLPLLCASLGFAQLASAQIKPGNLVVLRVGDGTAPLVSGSTATFLDEFTTSGTAVQTLPMPVAASGSNLPCTNSGTATSEGFLNLSSDGKYLVAAGYSAAPGVSPVTSTTSLLVPRVIARIGIDGTIDTSTSIDNLFSGGNIRSAATTDGSEFWATGSNSGVVYSTLGSASGLGISTGAPTNVRVAGVANGELYISTGSGSAGRIFTVGSGIPNTAGQTQTAVPGFPLSGASPYDFFFADANTAYVADDGSIANGGGIQKYSLIAGTWTLQYVLVPGTAVCRGVTGYVDNGVATLWATTNATSANLLVAVTDTGAGSTFTTLATAPVNTAFRGVRFINVPYSVSFAGTGSPTTVGVPTIAPGNGLPVIGNLAFSIDGGNFVPNGFGFGVMALGDLGAGISVPGAPVTVQIYLNPIIAMLALADGNGDTSLPFGIPNIGAFAGLPVTTQFLAYDPTMPDAVPAGTSVGMQFVVGF